MPVPTPAPAASNLPVIAAVHATVRYPYDVSFIGIENVANRTAYHLQLDPRQAADAYPLREICRSIRRPMTFSKSSRSSSNISGRSRSRIASALATPNKDRIG